MTAMGNAANSCLLTTEGEMSEEEGGMVGDPSEGSQLTGLKETCLHVWGSCLEV